MAPRSPQAVLFMLRTEQRPLPDGRGAVAASGSARALCAVGGSQQGRPRSVRRGGDEEIGLDISHHKPWTVDDLEDWEGLNFDLIVTLSPEAHHKALQLTTTSATEVEYWPTPDPVGVEGRRELQLDAYRHVRDSLRQRIRDRFAPPGVANE